MLVCFHLDLLFYLYSSDFSVSILLDINYFMWIE